MAARSCLPGHVPDLRLVLSVPQPRCLPAPVPATVSADIARAQCRGPEQIPSACDLPCLVNMRPAVRRPFSLGPGGFCLPAAGYRLTPLLDIMAATAYYEGIAPDTGSCTPRNTGRQCGTGVFLLRPAPVRRRGPVKGKSPRDFLSPTAICHHQLSRR